LVSKTCGFKSSGSVCPGETGSLQPVRNYEDPCYPAGIKNSSNRQSFAGAFRGVLKTGVISVGIAASLFLMNPEFSTASETDIPLFLKSGGNQILCCRGSNQPLAMETGVKNSACKTAPLFDSGCGYASTGGVAYIAPAFISESDARKIIEDEFKKAGIKFEKHDKAVSEVKIPQKQLGMNPAGKTSFADKAGGVDYTVSLDGYSSKRNLGYIYVSEEDYKKLIPESFCGTLTVWAVKNAALIIRDEMEKYGKINTMVFYDPLGRTNRAKPRSDISPKQEAEQLLRTQVRESIKWMKENKI
jgi:hypothetical protein